VSGTTLLYELHDRAREQGVDGYRRMSRGELEAALGLAEPAGPTRVEAERRGPLGLLTLTGGGEENAVSLDTLDQLALEAERLAGEEQTRLIAVIGSGPRIFCAGADLPALRELPGAVVTQRGTAALERIAQVDVPTLALLNGHAVGGGIDLALACDWRYAAQGAKLRFIHNELGYCPPWGGAQRLARIVPPGVALRLFAGCELISVDEARELGIVDVVVERDRLLGRAESLASRLERAGREAVSATKGLVSGGAGIHDHEGSFAALWDARSQ